MANSFQKKINNIAFKANFGREIKPIVDWKIPYEIISVGDYKIKLIQKITLPEQVIIKKSRELLDLIEEGYYESLKLLMAEIGSELGLTYVQEAIELLNNKEKFAKLIIEKNIQDEKYNEWQDTLVKITQKFDIMAAKEKYNFFLVTFFMFMRCDNTWTEFDTELLSFQEYNAILKIIECEESCSQI